jgi:hypothetical protein
MAPDPPAAPTQIGQEARGVIGQTVIGATVIYGSVTIIQGQAGQPEPAAATASETPSADEPNPYQGLPRT